MRLPIRDFTESYAGSGIIRAHMPGHKGRGDLLNAFDITEIKGADSLFEAKGIIAESEKKTSEIFGSCKTLYSAGGSTLCIYTMLAMCLMGSSSRKVVAARNCHRAFLNVCVMLDAEVEWVYPRYESSIVSGEITADMIEAAITRAGEPVCVYITSPDYLGRLTPIDDIAKVCHRHGCRLLVDNAHGAYLRFINEDGVPLHPLFHGADICCDSAHKTLPVLTGGAYLHINDPSAEKYEGYAKELMAMFGSSSPSYLILRSLDSCCDFMENEAAEHFAKMKKASDNVKSFLSPCWTVEDGECGKLTILAPPSGYTGNELAEILRGWDIECEYSDNTHTVLMLTGLEPSEINAIGRALSSIPQPRIRVPLPDLSGLAPLRRAMSMREAAMAPREFISVDMAAGRICGTALSCCPPGIAAAAGGEIFSEEIINILKNYSIFHVNVVK
ncbi:MAG: aminotransferase class I/II-fold pyridoxal phosphate-dependent enzyme [Oscillospiraceae bacterium]|nr:aminotransferase class I/II-fold pyridoxal phosphate-dependent enzyme [Oscillospiraceae bacterium]